MLSLPAYYLNNTNIVSRMAYNFHMQFIILLKTIFFHPVFSEQTFVPCEINSTTFERSNCSGFAWCLMVTNVL